MIVFFEHNVRKMCSSEVTDGNIMKIMARSGIDSRQTKISENGLLFILHNMSKVGEKQYKRILSKSYRLFARKFNVRIKFPYSFTTA